MALNLPSNIHVKAVTYGTPRVGNPEFAALLDSKVCRHLSLHSRRPSLIEVLAQRYRTSSVLTMRRIWFPSSQDGSWASSTRMGRFTSSLLAMPLRVQETTTPTTRSARSRLCRTSWGAISLTISARTKESSLAPSSAIEAGAFVSLGAQGRVAAVPADGCCIT